MSTPKSGFKEKQKQLVNKFATLLQARENSISQQEHNYFHYGIRSSHSDKLESAQQFKAQSYRIFSKKMRQLKAKLICLAKLEDNLFQQQQIEKLKKERTAWQMSIVLINEQKKIPLEIFQAKLKRFLAMLSTRLEKFDMLIYKSKLLKNRLHQRKNTILHTQVDVFLQNIKKRVNDQELFYQPQAIVACPISLKGPVEVFINKVSRGIHCGEIYAENLNEKLWGASYKDGTYEAGALLGALEQNATLNQLSSVEKNTICYKLIKVMDELPDFSKHLPVALTKIAEVKVALELNALNEKIIAQEKLLLKEAFDYASTLAVPEELEELESGLLSGLVRGPLKMAPPVEEFMEDMQDLLCSADESRISTSPSSLLHNQPPALTGLVSNSLVHILRHQG